jgi:hypothetical protein
MIRATTISVLLVIAALPAGASGFGDKEAGTSAASFLKLGADARAAGMGGAVHAAVDDATAIYWNPAGLAGLRYRHATMTHGASYQNTFQDFVAYAQPIEAPFAGNQSGRERDLRPDQFGTLGIAVLYQNAGPISEIDNTATPTGDRINPQDLAVIVAWGATVARGVDVGVGIKYITTKIQGDASTGAAAPGSPANSRTPCP